MKNGRYWKGQWTANMALETLSGTKFRNIVVLMLEQTLRQLMDGMGIVMGPTCMVL